MCTQGFHCIAKYLKVIGNCLDLCSCGWKFDFTCRFKFKNCLKCSGRISFDIQALQLMKN